MSVGYVKRNLELYGNVNIIDTASQLVAQINLKIEKIELNDINCASPIVLAVLSRA